MKYAISIILSQVRVLALPRSLSFSRDSDIIKQMRAHFICNTCPHFLKFVPLHVIFVLGGAFLRFYPVRNNTRAGISNRIYMAYWQ